MTIDESRRRRIAASTTHFLEGCYRSAREGLEEYRAVWKEGDDGPPERPDYVSALAILGYALGAPLEEVRDHGRRAVRAFREVLRLRPPLEMFQKPIAPATWLDYSVGSSSVGLHYLYWALLLREHELAREIAENTWDPPSMGRVRIFPEYRVAYGLRDLILGRPATALSELGRLPASANKYFHRQARAISALARGTRPDVVAAIAELAPATLQAMRREYLPQYKIFALPGAALASYALDHGLLSREELPRDVDTFPMELVVPQGG